MAHYLSAQEAADRLGISVNTLYAYVSRGLIRSEPSADGSRQRRYRADDVERLAAEREHAHNPKRLAETALDWGAPVLESAITFISEGRLYYRGHDATHLARDWHFEAVAALIWGEAASPTDLWLTPALPDAAVILNGQSDLPRIRRFQLLLPLMAAADVRAYDLRPAMVVRTGARIVQTFAAAAGAAESPVAAGLAAIWERPTGRSLIEAALILCADHELNASSFAARVAASAGATPYEAVAAGLAALQGVKHGGRTEQVEAFLRELKPQGDVRALLANRLRRGESIPGFGHRLYPKGDPRALYLLEALRSQYPDPMQLPAAVEAAAREILNEAPTLDFALAALTYALGLPVGSSLTLFALGRTVGWIGHALEQYQTDQLIRPRARYTGVLPG